jgi:predicted SnoaL-like aldol condensation-catalyzing enzyme
LKKINVVPVADVGAAFRRPEGENFVTILKTSAGLVTVLVAVLVAVAAPAVAQQPTLAPGCTATPAQIEANKKVAMEFFRPGISGPDRVALADPSYLQHNPAFKKGAQEAKLGDFEYFKSRFGGPARGGGGGDGARAGGPAGPAPPPGNPLEIVMAECDLVTIIHKNVRQDPTAAPGTFYEVFTFDTFRVRNGKLTEHWDGAVINPPAAGPGGRGN